MSTPKLVIGNWKMNGSSAQVRAFADLVVREPPGCERPLDCRRVRRHRSRHRRGILGLAAAVAVLLLCGGAGLVLYALLWIFVPNE